MRLSLFKRRFVPLPTPLGCLVIGFVLVLMAFAVIRSAYPILAPTDRVAADLLVVEGWLPEYALEAAIKEFHSRDYQILITSGGPLWEGHHASNLGSYAALAGKVLTSLAFDPDLLQIVPGPKVWRHRTYHSAVAVREHLLEHNSSPKGINIVTLGPHGRRTSIIYSQVLGDIAPLGIISLPSAEYDPEAWWKTSEGTKHVITETMAATYEWLFKSGRKAKSLPNR